MENFGFIQFMIVLVLSVFIVYMLRKMSNSDSIRFGEHYRCSNDFYHYFSRREIEFLYGGKRSVYLCPRSGCGGVLTLYEEITDEEYAELQKINYFED